MTEERVREIVGDAMTGLYKRIDGLTNRVDALAMRVDTPTEHKIQQVRQIDKLRADLDGVMDRLQKLGYDLAALESDVGELKQGNGSSGVAELALRIIAAERGLTA